MDTKPFYRHTTFEGVDTYTRAEHDENLGEHVHYLITKDEFEAAADKGERTEKVDL